MRTPAEQPLSEWWQSLCSEIGIPTDIPTEKFHGSDTNWSRLLDSAKTLSLFSKQKAILVFEAEKAIKADKDSPQWIQALKQAPHWVVFHSSQAPTKNLDLKVWESPALNAPEIDDKASFRWVDSLFTGNLAEALSHLENALQSDQHPLALIQLAARDFRLGRLIHYARENRLRETELSHSLKVSPFMIKKWAARPSLKSRHWTEIFDRILRADLEMKSGADQVWAIRKLTFDLIQIMSQDGKWVGARRLKKPSINATPLWPIAPSFA